MAMVVHRLLEGQQDHIVILVQLLLLGDEDMVEEVIPNMAVAVVAATMAVAALV